MQFHNSVISLKKTTSFDDFWKIFAYLENKSGNKRILCLKIMTINHRKVQNLSILDKIIAYIHDKSKKKKGKEKKKTHFRESVAKKNSFFNNK